MLKGIRFISESEKKEHDLKEMLLKEGGIMYYEKTDPETKEVKKIINILGIELETYASKEEIQKLKEGLILSEFDQELLKDIAECYKLKQPMMIEGDPGIGKTFLLKKFIRFIHGENAPILELNGSPRTSELEILGHWAPKGLKKEEEEQYKEFLKNVMASQVGIDLQKNFNEKLAELNKKLTEKKISQEDFQKFFGEITTHYINESKKLILEMAQLTKFIKPDSEWEFKEGALLQAYHGREGKGYILLVDEFNLIPSNYQQIFLQIGGEKGELSNSISFWGNTGRVIYPRGKDTWICFASNYPEKTAGRNEVVAPMTDRLVWRTITQEEVEKKKDVIRYTAGGRLIGRTKNQVKSELIRIPVKEQIQWDKVLNEQLGEYIADFLLQLDKHFIEYYEKTGDEIEAKGENRGQLGRRIQKLEFSGRNLLRLYSYLDHFQVRDSKTGLVDITATLKNAFKKYYLNRLANSEKRKKMEELFNEAVEGDTGKIEFEGKILTRKEVFDILVERASITEEEKQKIEEKKKEYQERQFKQIKNDIEDLIKNELFKKSNIPDKIKNLLQ